MDQQLPNPLLNPAPSNIYPTINISLIQNPSRLWAFPFLGGLVKVLILIPVFIWLGLVYMYAGILVILNSFVVLFTGKYWAYAYSIYLGALRLQTKSGFFFMGLTDRYPGFGLNTTDFSLDMEYPESSNRLLALPFIGILARIILLIPFFIWSAIIQNAILLGGFVLAPWVVLFTGKYPESIYELVRDGQRISLAQSFYFAGISDKYPNFWISFNHQIKKVLLLVFGGLVFASSFLSSPGDLTSLEKELLKYQETSPNNGTSNFSLQTTPLDAYVEKISNPAGVYIANDTQDVWEDCEFLVNDLYSYTLTAEFKPNEAITLPYSSFSFLGVAYDPNTETPKTLYLGCTVNEELRYSTYDLTAAP